MKEADHTRARKKSSRLKEILYRRVIVPLNNISLQKRLVYTNLIIYVVFVIVTAACFSIVSYNRLSEQSAFTLVHNFDQSQSYINTKLQSMMNLSDSIIFNAYLNSTINREYNSQVELVDAIKSMRGILQSMKGTNGTENICIYVGDSWTQAVDNYYFRSISQLENNPVFDGLLKQNQRILFVETKGSSPGGTERDYISLFRIMKSTNNYRQISFILRLDLPKSDFTDILSNTNPTSTSCSLILDSAGSCIAASGAIPESSLSGGLFTLLTAQPEKELQNLTLGFGKYMCIRTGISGTDWMMVTLVPHTSFMTDFQKNMMPILQISLLIILLTIITFCISSFTITRRILVLSNVIRETRDDGKLKPITAPVYRDEIGLLYTNYNEMIHRIEELLAENYAMGQSLKNAEYEALQSQINPHFLYNTLDMISWFSLQGKSARITDVVYSLARFYKISLARGKSIITIQEELEHADCYMNIQMNRFRGRILYSKDIDPEILSCSIPKITLQPILENAIFHGILEKTEGCTGSVKIRGRIEDNVIHITVTDDGKGMPDPSADGTSSSSQGGSSYGLKNIILRIQLLYGSDFGVDLDSRPGHGTAVHISLPAMKPEEVKTLNPR